MLDQFRSIDITWDKANKRIYDNVKAVSSDEQGRKLVVQILNNNQVEDLTGASLNLFWETKSKHYQGLDLFDVVDAEKGIFEIYFTTGMLSNIGRLNAHLHLLDGNGAITSELFKIHVSKGIDTEAVESEDSFSALTESLNRVAEIETQEQERIDNETERKSAEVDRKSNETTREENEIDRKEHETQRKSAETNRINAETTRQENEDTREINETTRVNSESNRETTFTTLKDEAEGLVDDLDEKYEGFEHEYAPRLNEIEDDYVWFDKESSEGVLEDLWGGQAKIHPNTVDMADYVVEQGENYTKWASGKAECWTAVPYNDSVEFEQALSIYTRSDVYTWAFPVDFLFTPAVVGSSTDFSSSQWVSVGSHDKNVARWRYLSFRTPGNYDTKGFGIYAVGRWK